MKQAKEFKELLITAHVRYDCTADWTLDKSNDEEVIEYEFYKREENQAYLNLIQYVLNNSDEIQKQLMDLIPKD